MLVLEKGGKEEVVISRKFWFLIIAIGAAAMGGTTFWEFSDGIMIESPFDIFGLAFLCLWLCVVFSMSIYCALTFSKKVTISREGITSNTFFIKKEMKWAEIIDYGLSYTGETRGEGHTYELYFSTEWQKSKNERRKKLKGNVIRVFVFESEYSIITEQVIPFCKECTTREPFIGKG